MKFDSSHFGAKPFIHAIILLLCIVVACDKNTEQTPNSEPEPELEPEPVEDVTIIDCSNPDEFGIEVVSIGDYAPGTLNTTMVIEASEDVAPKVGDYLYSGVTEKAPYGYFYQITEVNEQEPESKVMGMIIYDVAVTALLLDDILSLMGKEIGGEWYDPFDLEVVDYAEGDQFYEDDGGFVVLDETFSIGTQEPDKDKREAVVFHDTSLKGSISVKLKLYLGQLNLYLKLGGDDRAMMLGEQMKTRIFYSVGLKIEGSESTKIQFSKQFRNKFMTFKMPPITVGYLVFTPKLEIEPYIKYGGNVKLNATYNQTIDTGLSFICDFRHGYLSTVDDEPFVTWKPDQSVESDGSLGISADGYVSGNLDVKFSMGLYGSNYIEGGDNSDIKILSVEPTMENELKLSAELGAEWLPQDDTVPFKVKDDCSLKAAGKFHVKTSLAKVETKKKNVVANLAFDSEEFDVYNYDLSEKWFHFKTLLFPQFKKPDVHFKDKSTIALSLKKYKPLLPCKEVSCGIYVRKNGEILDVIEYDGQISENSAPQEMEFLIPKSDFAYNERYEVIPYTVSRPMYLPQCVVMRDGITFMITEDGDLSVKTIEDVPGENL